MLVKNVSRWALLSGITLSLPLGLPLTGCAPGVVGTDVEGQSETSDELTDVPHSVVKRQSIGNCWLYATASWLESMELAATGTELNVSESYWTYWHWFEQIVNGESDTEISTGGHYSTSTYLIERYGVLPEASFIPSESDEEMSDRQHDALDYMNAELKTGSLSTPAARADKVKVRAALDTAFGLSPSVKSAMTKVFGAGFSRNLTTISASTGLETARTTGTQIKRARNISVSYTTGPGKPAVTKKLTNAIAAWTEVSYPWTDTARRDFQKRFQRALHDRQPVMITWYVDFAALDDEGRFAAPPAAPGRQGGHMTVMDDYEITDVPGYGTLPAGTLETRPAALTAALSSTAKLKFIRVKNSWGSAREDRQFSIPGYHDLYLDYLNGPIKKCEQVNDTSDPNDCYEDSPFEEILLPPGY